MNIFDKIVNAVSPKTAFLRERYRFAHALMKEQARRYEAASKGRRTEGWSSSGTSANAEISTSLIWLRNRSRQLVRDTKTGRRIVQAIANNTIGTGIRPTPIAERGKLADKKLKQIWKDWAEKKECDFDGKHNIYGLQRLAMRCIVESGEVLIRKRRTKGRLLPIQLQVIEPDFIDTDRSGNTENGGYIYYGIEFDAEGRLAAYWLFDRHPGDEYRAIKETYVSKRIPASEIIHAYFVERPGQIRGVPWMASVMIGLRDADDYEDAQLIRQKIAACFTVFVTDFDGRIDGAPGVTKDATTGDLHERVEPGMIMHTPPGKDVKFADPPPVEGFVDYMRNINRGIASGTGITYESLTGDLSNVNFSSGRMGWIEMNKNVEDWQLNMIVPMMCENIWEWFTDAAIIAGKIRTEIPADWTTPRREMIDPVKETKAIKDQIRSGLKSWPEAVREMGYEPGDVLEEIAQWMKDIDKLGITLDTDARNDLLEPTSDGKQQKSGGGKTPEKK